VRVEKAVEIKLFGRAGIGALRPMWQFPKMDLSAFRPYLTV
jgi:hypothetical protein